MTVWPWKPITSMVAGLVFRKFSTACTVPIGECGFRLGEAKGPFVSAFKAFGILQGSLQQTALGLGIGIGLRGAALDDVFTISADEGHINAVQRGAGHEA